MPTGRTRRRIATAIAMIIAAAALTTGCAPARSPESPNEHTGSTRQSASHYPLTLHNAYGDVTIPSKPTRVATLGYADVALASSLGANVVLAPKSFTTIAGAGDDPNLPYLQALPKDTVWINPMSINVEQVAAAKPDLILATAGFTVNESLYKKLREIAPVVTYEKQLYAASSEDSARRVAAALGETEAADKLIADADAAVKRVKEELPNIDGGTFLYGQARDGVVVMLLKEQNVTARFMKSLGMIALPAVAELDGTGSVPGSIDVSFEQAPLFNDAGVLFMTYQSDALQRAFEQHAIISRQPIMSSRYVPVDLETATALQDPNIAAVPWLIEQLRPGLKLIPKR